MSAQEIGQDAVVSNEVVPEAPMLDSGLYGLLQNSAFVAGLLGFAVAQFAKLFTHWIAHGEFKLSRIIGSGGMPSSHTALVTALTCAVAVKEGTSSDVFAICVVFALVVMYDAAGIRLQAGHHAAVLNRIVTEFPPDSQIHDSSPSMLRETLGHTPLQVFFGAIVGILVGTVYQLMWMS